MLKFREFDIKNIISTVRSRSGDNQFDPERAKMVEELVELNMRGAAINAVADMMGESMVPIFKKLIGDELAPPPVHRFPRKIGAVATTKENPLINPDNLKEMFESMPTPYPPETPESKIELTIHLYPGVKPSVPGDYLVLSKMYRSWVVSYYDEIKDDFSLVYNNDLVTHWAGPILDLKNKEEE